MERLPIFPNMIFEDITIIDLPPAVREKVSDLVDAIQLILNDMQQTGTLLPRPLEELTRQIMHLHPAPFPQIAQERAFADYLDASAEMGDEGLTVCTAHQRFLPCRRNGTHVISAEPADIDAVKAYHAGNGHVPGHNID